MVDSIVDNYSMRSEHRAELKLELSLKTSSEDIETFMEKVKATLEKSKDEIVKHSVFFTEFNKLKQSLILSFKKIVENLKIEMASGGADIHIIQGDGEPVPPTSKTII